MRAPLLLAMVFAVLSGPAMAACPSAERIGKICKAGADLAAELASDMPAELGALRLTLAVGTVDGLMIVGEPAADGSPPDPARATEYLCGYEAVRTFVSAGGAVAVLLNASPFLTLTSCEAT